MRWFPPQFAVLLVSVMHFFHQRLYCQRKDTAEDITVYSGSPVWFKNLTGNMKMGTDFLPTCNPCIPIDYTFELQALPLA